MHDRRQQACQHVGVSASQHEKSTHYEALPAAIECRDSAAVCRRNVLQRTTGGSERSVPIHTVFYHAITRMHFAKRLHVMLGGAPSGIVSRFTATLIGGGSALPLAIGAALLATLFYGFAVNYSKRHLAGVNAFVVAFGSQVSAGRTTPDFLFPSRLHQSPHLSTRQYSRLVHRWVASIGLDDTVYGTHTMRRTKASLIYRRTKNLRAVQLLLGHSKLESTVRYLDIEVDDALEMAEQTDI
jgi:integrase